jgi:type IV pilus assembly protein PilN
MMRINLLPHREKKRQARKIQFAALSIISLLAGVVLMGFVHLLMNAKIAYQERRNAYLEQEITVLDRQIEQIKKLREQTDALLARKNVVEGLQSTRADVVHLLDQMLRILPEGVYIKSIKQNGKKIDMTGLAQSSARVSTLMRAIEDSPWLDSPLLTEVHAVNVNSAKLNEYSLSFNLTKIQDIGKKEAKTSEKKVQ